jgi:hypothetical protein
VARLTHAIARARVLARPLALALPPAPLGLAFAFAFAVVPVTACAQALESLHVRNFSLATDRTSVREGEPFHLTISAHVDEEVLELDNVTLPNLTGFESLGDERRCSASARGTDCVEILTLDGTQAGTHTLGPVTLDAVDGRSGRASRFATNSVVVTVEGASGLSGLARSMIVGALVGLATAALWWGFVRRRRTPAAPPPPVVIAPPPVAVAPDPASRYRDLVAALEREPSRARAFDVRAELRRRAGAGAEETLGDLEARGALLGRPGDLAALRAIERAAFCEDSSVERAVREAIPYLTI